jgi:pantothenate kinase
MLAHYPFFQLLNTVNSLLLIVSFDIAHIAILTSTKSNGVPLYFYGAF